jgi:predicted nucleotidyltransferase
LAQPILASVFACDTVETWISEFLSTAYPQPRAVFLFGSFARRDGTVDSDVDVFVDRVGADDEDHTSWAHMRADLVHRIERWTGNRSQLVEVSSTNLADAIASDQPLLKSLLVDGRVLSGDPIDKLLHLRRPIEQTEVKR